MSPAGNVLLISAIRAADFICNLKRIGTGKGEDGNVCGLLAAETREDRVLLLAQLDFGDVLDAHDGGGLIGLGGLRGSGWPRSAGGWDLMMMFSNCSTSVSPAQAY